jgi:hypothetical protein
MVNKWKQEVRDNNEKQKQQSKMAASATKIGTTGGDKNLPTTVVGRQQLRKGSQSMESDAGEDGIFYK